MKYVQGAAIELTPPQLRSYVIEGLSILLPHPVLNKYYFFKRERHLREISVIEPALISCLFL